MKEKRTYADDKWHRYAIELFTLNYCGVRFVTKDGAITATGTGKGLAHYEKLLEAVQYKFLGE